MLERVSSEVERSLIRLLCCGRHWSYLLTVEEVGSSA